MTATGQTFGRIETRTVSIATNLASKEYTFVNLDTTTDELVGAAADATKMPFVLIDAGDGSVTAITGSIAVGGRVKITLGGTVSAGDKLTATTGGLAITTITNKDHYGLIALHNGVSGDIIEALIAFGTVSAT